MGTSLSVKHDGSWRTVVEPYIKVDDSWKTVHNVWIKHGGDWELAHKNAIGRYTQVVEFLDQTITPAGADQTGSFTVPANVRYLRVSVTGGGGQGAGGASTYGLHPSYSAHYTCAWDGSTTGPEYATGGQGGHPGNVDVQFEVIPGEVYTWSGGAAGIHDGDAGGPLGLSYHSGLASINPVGDNSSGGTGSSGANLTFTGTSATIMAGGGIGGASGVVTVSANCTGPASASHLLGYTISTTNPGQSARNDNSISATNLITTTTNGTASSGGGDGGTYDTAGSYGTNGTISIWKYV